jgi:toxin ParE1/3/4
MSEIRRRPGVDEDILELATYLLERSEPAARRFVDAVQETLKELASEPGMGSPKKFPDPDLAQVRSWRIKGFPNHLIYYIPLENGIDVLTIIHGARDVETFLENRA